MALECESPISMTLGRSGAPSGCRARHDAIVSSCAAVALCESMFSRPESTQNELPQNTHSCIPFPPLNPLPRYWLSAQRPDASLNDSGSSPNHEVECRSPSLQTSGKTGSDNRSSTLLRAPRNRRGPSGPSSRTSTPSASAMPAKAAAITTRLCPVRQARAPASTV
eukprot:scaffold63087_cov68-Phaeocystis_antarctica.AAC.4